jgi:SAM-dependent methyltransferase
LDFVDVPVVVQGILAGEKNIFLAPCGRCQFFMHRWCVKDFRNPSSNKAYKLEVFEESGNRIKRGRLIDPDGADIPIIDHIPRFVGAENYARSFGMQWNLFRTTQLDSHNGTTLTRDRFYSGTKWDDHEMEGESILEAGCGAGRFTEILLGAKAKVYSFDYSNAVDACYKNNAHDNLCLFQGDIYSIPFEQGRFDKIFCHGVLQHLPDSKSAFMNLVKFLRKGGKMSIDVYMKDGRINSWKSKYIWRPITTRLDPDTLFKVTRCYISKWLRIDTFLKKTALLRGITLCVPCWNYVGWPLTDEQRLEWAILDTFDALSARYDRPQTIEEVTSWFEEAKLEDVEVSKGGNGIIGNATKG